VSGALGTVLTVTGAVLLVAGIYFIGASLVSIVRAWRGGLPWWSGGMIWFTPSRQPPAARPHMQAALRRWLAAVPLLFGGMLLLIMAGA
jgi:hypothetical protein